MLSYGKLIYCLNYIIFVYSSEKDILISVQKMEMNLYNRIMNHQLKRRFILGPIFLVVFLCMGTGMYSQNKLALVIGNSDYDNAQLRNSVNDANDIAIMLITKGFNVSIRTNLNQDSFEESLRTFTESIRNGDIVLFYYSGHGMQVKGENYLIPVNEKIVAENEIRHKSISLGFLLDKLYSSGSAVNIIVLDACRDNPFSGFRSSTKGFSSVNAPVGTIISYSTSPGSVARDGVGRNSPYTESLLECIDIPNLQLETFFKEVRIKVLSKTEGQQKPWESSSLIGDFYFTSGKDVYSKNQLPVSQQSKRENKPSNAFIESKPIEDFSSNSGIFIDSRDSHEYKWVKIGDQVWMAENLNIGHMIPGKQKQEDNISIEKYCYKNIEENCEIYGGLYQWKEMIAYTYHPQGICPKGWHVPSDKEWELLVNIVGGKKVAGSKLKEHGIEHWRMSTKAKRKFGYIKDVGFNALPGGYRSSQTKKFGGIGTYGIYRTASKHSYVFSYKEPKVSKPQTGVNFLKAGYSVRCVKD